MQKKIKIVFDAARQFIDQRRLDALLQAQKQLSDIREAGQNSQSRYAHPASFINVPFDDEYFTLIKQVVTHKKSLNCTHMVVLGIGGSYLGSQAVHHAINGAYWNECGSPRVYFADTLDPAEMSDVFSLIKHALDHKERVLLVVVSKTGSTLETNAHYAVFIDLLKHNAHYDYRESVIVISNENSSLADHAIAQGYTCVSIPKSVEGRYTVFTAVGMVVVGLLGVDIDQLRIGAQQAITDTLTQPIADTSTALSAAIICASYKQGNILLDTFLFSKKCASIGAWYRQLFGESLGKPNVRGELQHIVPTVTIGSNDLHSVAQLYLGGRPAMLTTFVTVENWQRDVQISAQEFVPALNGHSYGSLMKLLFKSTQQAYDEQQMPYIHIQLPEISAFYIGYLLQWYMLQVVYVASLLEVNPFDQPHVELYKKYARQHLT